MKKIWSFISMLAIGFAAGLITMYKLMGEQVEVNIKRIKTKRGSSDIDIPINIEKPVKAKKRGK